MSRQLLSLEDVTVCYARRPAVHHCTAQLPCGAFVGIVGPNGAGKSTLLQGALGWLPLTGGRVTIGGKPLKDCRERLTYLPQRKAMDLDFPATVQDVVAQGRYQRLGWWKGFGPADHAAVHAAIDAMGLHALAERPFANLSGGQQQRVVLARAFATGADILLLDEPLTGLDATASYDLLERLGRWAQGDRLAVAVIHDLDAVRRWCTHVLLINRSIIACGPVAKVMTEENLARCYGAPVEEHHHGH